MVRRWGSFDFTTVLAAYARSGFAALAAGVVGAAVLWLLGGYTFGFAWDSIVTAVISCAVVGLVMATAFLFALRMMKAPEFTGFIEPLARRFPILARLGR